MILALITNIIKQAAVWKDKRYCKSHRLLQSLCHPHIRPILKPHQTD